MNSVFLYDILLDAQNFGAINWLDKDLNEFIKAYRFYRWYNKYFGMSIEILENGRYQEIHKFGDLGPISWSERAISIPINKGGKISLRLKFMPDNWQIDWLGIALNGRIDADEREHRVTIIPNVQSVSSTVDSYTMDEDDDIFFIQYPGHATNFQIRVDDPLPGLERSWFIRSKGYYTEWLREKWLSPLGGEEFSIPIKLNEELIKDLARTWILKKDDFEKTFFEMMIPVSQDEL